MYIEIFAAGFAIMLASLSGKLVMWGALGKFLQNNLKFLITFALGTFTATLYLLFSEVRELQAPLSQIAIAAALGALILEVLQRFVPEAHHHHGSNESDCCEHNHKDTKHTINPKRILLGDAFHNIGDGIILVPAYLISLSTGVVLTIGILLHELVQETSEFFLLKEAGYSTRRALVSNFLVSSTILIGIIFSIFVNTATDYSPLLVSFAMGALFYIIVRDLLPHTINRIKHSGRLYTHLVTGLFGIILILFIASTLHG